MEINVTPPINKQLTQEWYDDLALKLMNNYQLKRENAIYNFSEIEIYASFDLNEQDIFRHKTKDANITQLKNTFQLGNSKLFYWHYSGADIVMGDGKSFYCGILIRGIQKDNEWIFGPSKIAYPAENNHKKINLELIQRDTIRNYTIVQSALSAIEIIEDKIFKLPRHNLSVTTLHKELISNNISVIDHYKREVRYIRLPNNFLKRSKKDLPEDYASIIRKYL